MNDVLYEECKKSIYVVTREGKMLNRGRAVIHIFSAIGYGWMKLALVPPLIYFVDIGYMFVARNRRFFSKFLFTEERELDDELS